MFFAQADADQVDVVGVDQVVDAAEAWVGAAARRVDCRAGLRQLVEELAVVEARRAVEATRGLQRADTTHSPRCFGSDRRRQRLAKRRAPGER